MSMPNSVIAERPTRAAPIGGRLPARPGDARAVYVASVLHLYDLAAEADPQQALVFKDAELRFLKRAEELERAERKADNSTAYRPYKRMMRA